MVKRKDGAKKAKAVDFHLGKELRAIVQAAVIPESHANSYCQETIKALNVLRNDESVIAQLNALKRIGTNISNAKGGIEKPVVSFFLEGVLPIVIYIFFHGKGVQPVSASLSIVEQLHALELFINGSQETLNMFQDHASQYLSQLTSLSAEATLERDDFAQITITLYMLSDWAQGANFLEKHHGKVFSHLVSVLDVIVERICKMGAEDDKEGEMNNEQQLESALQSGGSFSRREIAYCHEMLRLLTNFTLQFDALVSGALDLSGSDDICYDAPLNRFAGVLTRLLFTPNASTKECHLLAGISLGAALKVQPKLRILADSLVCSDTADTATEYTTEALVIKNCIYKAESTTRLVSFFNVTCKILDSTNKSAVRVMAIHSLSSFYSVISRLSLSNSLTTLMRNPDDIFSRTFLYVCTFWDDPIDGMNFKLRNVFSVLVEILVPDSDGFSVRRVADSLVRAEGFRKFKYDLLSFLLDKYPPSFILVNADIKDFLDVCFSFLGSTAIQSRVCLFISKLYVAFLSQGIVDSKLWITPLLGALCSDSQTIRKAISDSILVPILKKHPEAYTLVLDELSRYRSGEILEYRFHGMFSVMKAGRTLDLVPESSGMEAHSLPILDALLHPDESLRADALGFLCESRKALTEPTEMELNAMKMFLVSNATESTAEFRQRVRGCVQKLVARIRRCLYANSRKLAAESTYSTDPTLIASLKKLQALKTDFLRWLLAFVINSLYPGNPYARCALSLEIIHAVLEADRYVIDTTFFADKDFRLDAFLNEDCAKALVSVLATTGYDQSRDMAFTLLMGMDKSILEGLSDEYLRRLVEQGMDMAIQPRIRESESGASLLRFVFSALASRKFHLWSSFTEEPNLQLSFVKYLLEYLETNMKSEKQVEGSSLKYSIHGVILALRFIFSDLHLPKTLSLDDFQNWRGNVAKLTTLCLKSCDSVLSVLTQASPEGTQNLEDGEQADEDGKIDSGPSGQAPLFYSFRTLKEATAAMTTVSTSTGCFDVAEEIRHRGAFSAVYATFVDLCAFVSRQRVDSLNQLPSLWLNKLLKMISAFSVSTTRRSAGLPLAISAILINPSPFQTRLLSSTMAELFKQARVPMEVPEGKVLLDVPQIHAFNIMRELLLHSELSNLMRDYIGEAFILSIKSFSSPYFPLRNCATMLFSTLVSKSLGTKRDKNEDDEINTVTTRAFFSKSPELYAFLLEVLEKDDLISLNEKDISKSVIYPILTVLVRLKPLRTSSHHDGFDMKRFETAIERCLSLPYWHLRDIAARSFAALISTDDAWATLERILKEFIEGGGEDRVHGVLLQITSLLLNGRRDGILKGKAGGLIEKMWLFSKGTLINRAASLRILNILLDIVLEETEESHPTALDSSLQKIWRISCKAIESLSTRHPGEVRYRKECTIFILKSCEIMDASKVATSQILSITLRYLSLHGTPMQYEAISFLEGFERRRELQGDGRIKVLEGLAGLVSGTGAPAGVKEKALRFLIALERGDEMPKRSEFWDATVGLMGNEIVADSKARTYISLLIAFCCSKIQDTVKLEKPLSELASTMEKLQASDEQFAFGEVLIGCLDLVPWKLLSHPSYSTFTFYRLLFSCLSDAVMDVRDRASRIASKLIGSGANVGPFTARVRLLKLMCDKFLSTANEDALSAFLTNEMIGKDIYATLKQAYETRKNLLFPHEESNIYRDQPLESILAFRGFEYIARANPTFFLKRSADLFAWSSEFMSGVKADGLAQLDGSNRVCVALLRLVTVVQALNKFSMDENAEKRLAEVVRGKGNECMECLTSDGFKGWESMIELCPEL
ncbi:hypothetical protein HDU67_006216 [Dinochytrium kinnereticum]|nr:hypothetical protein HDU67_006216 [Dinochytrium kinnereticum]